MHITKNQHYVPQLLLRNFSSDDEVINVYDHVRSSQRSGNIKKFFSENYFYDRDNLVENFLSTEIEGPAATVINEIIRDPKSHTSQERGVLLRFIMVQLTRTPEAAATTNNVAEGFLDTLSAGVAELNDLPTEEVREVKIRLADPKDLLRLQTVGSTVGWPLLADLEQKLLVNKTGLPFVISDNPIVHYNWFLRDSRDMAASGIIVGGVQLFLPISPSLCLCLSDRDVYKLGTRNATILEISNQRDIEIINELQFRGRFNLIAYRDSLHGDYIKRGCVTYPAGTLYNHCSQASKLVPISDEFAKSTHASWREQLKLKNWLSFVKVKRKARRTDAGCYVRKPEVAAAVATVRRQMTGSVRKNSSSV